MNDILLKDLVHLTAKRKEALDSLEIITVRDLLEFYPSRYESIEYIPFSQWSIDKRVNFEGVVLTKPKMTYFKGKQSVVYFDVSTEYDNYRISIFNRPWLTKLKIGERITVFGKYEGGNKVLAINTNSIPLQQQLGIQPFYSLKDKLTDKYFRGLINEVLEKMKGLINDFIPDYLTEKYNYLHKYNALKIIHNPSSAEELLSAINTLKYEEFLKFNLVVENNRKANEVTDSGFCKRFNKDKLNDFIDSLPFTLTDDQLKAVNEILENMQSNQQMLRLLQGDVGCGKTIVAFICMYGCYLSGKQSVLLAPTELLVKQHYRNLCKIFENTEVKPGLLCSSQSLQQRKDILSKINSGEINMIVGTHSLFQDEVKYHDLGLVVTDEQHRFGVKQRQSMIMKGNYPDILFMSATPIPRTLANTLYGDLNVSTIEQTPNSGKVIHTQLIKQNSFIPVINSITKLLDEGNQMYVVCPGIEKNANGRNVVDIYNNLKEFFKDRYTVGLLHGQLTNEEKQQTELDFKDGKINILVATTVIEVGVDVHNANIMVIYNANRFGLSQLHQLRGRIGRGDKEGYCYLLTDSDDPQTIERLNVIVNNTNGFDISYYDLKLRGPGDILGTRQSGLPVFVLGNVIRDIDLLNTARRDSIELFARKNEFTQIEEYLSENEEKAIILS